MSRAGIVNNAIPDYAAVLIDRLTRLRACTAPQAHLLTPAFARRTLRNAYHRLATLVRHGWLAMDAVVPSRGAATAHYYRLGNPSLRALGLENKVELLRRPAQHVLEYLLLRAEVYARASAAGWYVGSPIFLAQDRHGAALARFHDWLKSRALERLKTAQHQHAQPAQLISLKSAVEQLPAFLPPELTFEFLYRVDPKTSRTSSVVLLLADDVRRSVDSQVAALPLVAKADCGVLIRDCDSVYDPDQQSLVFTGSRLLELRRAVAARFGEQLSTAVDDVLPSVWGRATRSTATTNAIPADSSTTQQEQPQ